MSLHPLCCANVSICITAGESSHSAPPFLTAATINTITPETQALHLQNKSTRPVGFREEQFMKWRAPNQGFDPLEGSSTSEVNLAGHHLTLGQVFPTDWLRLCRRRGWSSYIFLRTLNFIYLFYRIIHNYTSKWFWWVLILRQHSVIHRQDDETQSVIINKYTFKDVKG